MKQIDNYIQEKLHIGKGYVSPKPEPWENETFDNPYKFLRWITRKLNNDCNNKNEVWDETGKWSPKRYGFKDFVITDGKHIEWVDKFKNSIKCNGLALWEKINSTGISEHPIVEFFKSNYDENIVYESEKYYVKSWGKYDISKHCKYDGYITITEATPDESGEPILCITITSKWYEENM